MPKLNTILVKGVTFALVAMLAACSSSSSTESDSSALTGDAAVQGNATISGFVTVQSTAQNQAVETLSNVNARTLRLQEATIKARHQALVKRIQLMDSSVQKGVINSVDDDSIVDMDGGTLYVSYLDSEGNVITTNITAEIGSDGSYTVPNLKDGINYILTAEKVGFDANGNINKIKSEAIVTIPTGEATAQGLIEPGSDIIMRTVISTIKETTDTLLASSGELDAKTKEIINTLVTSIITAVTEKIKEQISNGELAVETKVETIKTKSELDSFSEAEKQAERDKIKNQTKAAINTTLTDTDKKLKSELETDSSVSQVVNEATLKAQATKDISKMTLEEAKSLVRKEFGQSEGGTASDSSSGERTNKDKGGEGVPDFFVTQLANAYLSQKKVSITTYTSAYKQANTGESRTLEQLKTAFISDINTALGQLYDFYDHGTTTNINQFDNFAGAKTAFPSDKRITLPVTEQTQFDVLQLVSTFWFTGLFEHTDGDNEFDGYTFIKAMNLADIQQNKVYIIDSSLRPVKMYMPSDLSNPNNSTWTQTDALAGELNIFAEGLSESSVTKVVLRYTKANGSTATVEFNKESNDEHNNVPQSAKVQSSMAMMANLSAKKIAAYNIALTDEQDTQPSRLDLRYRLDPWQAMNNNQPSKIISDFKSGEATIQVLGADDVVLASTTVTIYKINMSSPEWVFPKGPDMAQVKQYGWDPNYETQIIALEQGKSELSKLRIEWKAPSITGSLPDGLRVAYSVFLGLQVHKKDWNSEQGDTLGLIPGGTVARSDGGTITEQNENEEYWDWADNNGNKWKHIWDSWQNGSFIFGTSITLPDKLKFPATQANIQKNYEANYEISIRPIVVDKRGMVVWEGEESRAAFKVGNNADWQTSISGTVKFPEGLETAFQHLKNQSGTWKIGLFMNNKEKVVNGKTKVRPVFWNQDLEGAREALKTEQGVALVATLGTMDEIKTNPNRSYTLPTFSKSDNLLKLNEDMSLKVWFDVSEAPQNDFRWQDVDPMTNAIDFADTFNGYNPIEEFTDLEDGNIRRGQEGMVRWRQNNQGAQFISDGGTIEVDGRVYMWITGATFQ